METIKNSVRIGGMWLGLSILLLFVSFGQVEGAESYTSSASFSQTADVQADMSRYDPTVLSVTFGKSGETDPVSPAVAQPAASEDIFADNAPSPLVPEKQAKPVKTAAVAVPAPEDISGAAPMVTPEPSSVILLSLGVGGLMLAARRRRQRQS